MNVDLACGQSKREGYFGIDIADVEGVDQVHDLMVFPWPLETSSVENAHCSHYVEHTPMDIGDGRDGLIAFMNELYRVCKPGALVEILHPYGKSERAFQDPTHRRFIVAPTWNYFNRAWREANRLDHYPITCDFEVANVSANGVPNDVAARDPETMARMMSRNWDVVADLHVVLRCLKDE